VKIRNRGLAKKPHILLAEIIMEDNLLSETSPLNTPIDDILPGCLMDNQFEGISEPEDEDEIPSYQPPRKPIAVKNQTNGGDRKRKAKAESLYSLEVKIKRTEESIKKLQKHLDNKTWPKSLRYSARVNIPPDEQFKKDVQAVKQKAEHGFLSALGKFNHHHLERQKNKLRKEKGKTPRKSTPERGSKNKSEPKLLSADISVKNLAAILGMDSENVSTLLSTLKEIVNNKDAEKYTSVH